MSAMVYKLFGEDLEDDSAEKLLIEGADIYALRDQVLSLLGAKETFYVVKVPSEGEPVERVCEGPEELIAAIRGLSADNDGQLFMYKGVKITMGEPSTFVPMSVGAEPAINIDMGKVTPADTPATE